MTKSAKATEANEPRLGEVISLQEASKRSGLSASHLRLILRRGEIWGMKLSRDWLTTEQAVREYLTRERKPGPKPRKK